MSKIKFVAVFLSLLAFFINNHDLNAENSEKTELTALQKSIRLYKDTVPEDNTAPFRDDGRAVLILHLDGDAKDSSGCSNNGRVKGEIEWVKGKFGKAAKFNQKGIIVVSPSGSMHVGDSSWTVECWFKPENQTAPHSEIFSSNYPFSTGYGLRISYNRDFGVQFSVGRQKMVHARGAVKKLLDGKWHRAAIVLDRENGGMIRMYIDGKEVTKRKTFQPLSVTHRRGTMQFLLGGLYGYKKAGFIGAVDEVRISNMVREPYRLKKSERITGVDAPTKKSLSIREKASSSTEPLILNPANTIITYSNTGSYSRKSALMLRKYLRAAHGEDSGFDIVTPGKIGKTDKRVIAIGCDNIVGEPNTNRLDKYGFLIKRKGKTIFIKGKIPLGTYLGTVRFLEEYAGVKFYMPGELFTYIPEKKAITVKALDMIENPYAVTCRATSHGPGGGEWGERLGLVRRNWAGSHQHTASRVFDPKIFAEKYPEIYPILKGKRFIPKGHKNQKWQPCFSEPKLVDAALEYAIGIFRHNSEITHFAISVMDSHSHCECERCSAVVDAMRKKLAPRFTVEERKSKRFERLVRAYAHSCLNIKFLNEFSDRLPPALAQYGIYDEKTIAYIAYSSVRIAPSEFDLKLRPNILPITVFKYSDVLIDKRFEPGRDGMDYFERWASCASQLGSHDWAFGKGFFIPRIYTKLIARTVKHCKKLGLRFGYAYAETSAHWGLDGPKYYIMAKTWWNPDTDVDKLWSEYCRDLFGKAADPMYNYFMGLEDLFVNDMNQRKEQKIFRYTRSFNDCTPAELAKFKKCRTYLNEALAKCEGEDEKKRIKLFSKTFKLTEMLLDTATGDGLDLEKKEKEIVAYAENTLMPDPMTLYGAGEKHAAAISGLKSALKQIVATKKRAATIKAKKSAP